MTLPLLGAGATALAAGALVFACGFDPPEKNPNPPGANGGGACKAAAGDFPPPGCDNSTNDCSGGGVCGGGTTSACCKIDPKCGDTTTCMPIGDNTGKSIVDLRIRRLNVATPPALAATFIQNVVVTHNIDLRANGTGGTPSCAENGQGSFNWMLRLDKTAGTMKTGGAPPTEDFRAGYCFVNETIGTLAIAPATAKITFTGDTFDSDVIPKLNVPIFVGGNVNNAVVLPLSDAVFRKVTLANGGNCVGAFNPKALESDCTEDPSTCQKWKTAGSLGGFITLEEADSVNVKDLNESLCVVLTATSDKTPDNKCPRGSDGKVRLKGDYCSTTKSPGGCQDSYWLAATFAASAAVITDGAGVAECQGGGASDAGADAASDAASDATMDAPIDAPNDGPVDAPPG